MKVTYLFLIVAVAFTACKKNVTPTTPDGKCTIYTINQGGGPLELVFNSIGELEELIYTSDLLTTIKNYRVDFFYNNDKLTETIYYADEGTIRRKLIYDSNGFIEKSIPEIDSNGVWIPKFDTTYYQTDSVGRITHYAGLYHKFDTSITKYTDYNFYYNISGNLIRYILDQNNRYSTGYRYSYSSEANPLTLNVSISNYTLTNDLRTTAFLVGDNKPASYRFSTYGFGTNGNIEYEYNSNGYPKEISLLRHDKGSLGTYTFEYNCQ